MTLPPNVTLNLPVPFPARVVGVNGVTVTKVNGVWQIGFTALNVGIAQVDFGAFPGASDALIAVTGQTLIKATSVLNARIALVDTADHSADEHFANPPRVSAGNILPGIGFTIFAINDDKWNEYPDPVNGGLGEGRPVANIGNTLTYGKWSVAWSWQ